MEKTIDGHNQVTNVRESCYFSGVLMKTADSRGLKKKKKKLSAGMLKGF